MKISGRLDFIWKTVTLEQKKLSLMITKRLKEHPNYKNCPKNQNLTYTDNFSSSNLFNI